MKNAKLLGIVVVLQVVTMAGQWLQGPSLLPAARADLPNPQADRQATIDQLKSIEGKLDQLITILNGGNLQVRVVQPDEHKDTGRTR